MFITKLKIKNYKKLKLIEKIANNKIFREKPIILMHIGSAGSNFAKWNKISSNSILVSIDGNNSSLKIKNKFLKVINENVFISNKNSISKFYVTKDPDCSSLLEPNKKVYENWYGAHRFKIKKKIKVRTVEINDFLTKKKIKYIDWFVIDVQGMDLKILKKLKNKIKNKITIIDIEPGFDFFYKKADTLSEVFEYMNKYFKFSDMTFGYNHIVKSENLSLFEKKILFHTNTPSKIYSNINFVNKVKNKRTILIELIFLIESKKFFEARDLIKKNLKKDKSFLEIKKSIDNLLLIYKIKFIIFLPFYYLKKVLKY